MYEQLPAAFLQRMEQILGQEYDAFVRSYCQTRVSGLRVNTLKIDSQRFREMASFPLEPVAWTPDGFYYPEAERPGKHPYHAAGLYYIQEPSAMAVVPFLKPQPGEKVLDLAAAPGGKSTQIAAAMQGRGLLVANEIHPARAKILSENMERCGARNAIVTNELPQKLAKHFPAFFDRILLDAPCSGEGMFRKDPAACGEWSEQAADFCSRRQWEIILEAEAMLKPGGVLIYSTCTFAPEENEQLISRFLTHCPAMKLVPLPAENSFQPVLSGAIKIWPHRVRGEGHFIALLTKDGQPGQKVPVKWQQSKLGLSLAEYEKFAEQYLNSKPQGTFISFGEHLYLLPPEIPSLSGLKVLRPGWHLGTLLKKRFEPSHALALAIGKADAKLSADYPAGSPEIEKYLRGEALQRQGPKGWTLVTVDGFSLGWGKQSDGLLKNHYPKGLRRP